MPGIDDAPGHRGGAGAVLFDELHRMRAGLGIDDIVDVALAPDGDVLAAMLGDRQIAHAGEQFGQLLRLRMREFDELETIGTGRVVLADFGGRGVVWEGTHGIPPKLAWPEKAI